MFTSPPSACARSTRPSQAKPAVRCVSVVTCTSSSAGQFAWKNPIPLPCMHTIIIKSGSVKPHPCLDGKGEHSMRVITNIPPPSRASSSVTLQREVEPLNITAPHHHMIDTTTPCHHDKLTVSSCRAHHSTHAAPNPPTQETPPFHANDTKSHVSRTAISTSHITFPFPCFLFLHPKETTIITAERRLIDLHKEAHRRTAPLASTPSSSRALCRRARS